MAKDIEGYLRELQEALRSAGADPALVQDALYDAEEYLQAEMAVGGTAGRGTATYETRLEAAIRGYGSPEEVAAAYMGIPPSVASSAASAVGRPAPVIGEAMRYEPPEAQPEAEGVEEGAEVAAGGAEALKPREAAAPDTGPGEAAGPARSCVRCGAELRPAARFCTVCGAAAGAAPPDGTAERGAPLVGAAAGAPYTPIPAGVQAGMAAAGAAAAAPAAARPSVWQQVFGVFADAAVWKALLYMIVSLATGIV